MYSMILSSLAPQVCSLNSKMKALITMNEIIRKFDTNEVTETDEFCFE